MWPRHQPLYFIYRGQLAQRYDAIVGTGIAHFQPRTSILFRDNRKVPHSCLHFAIYIRVIEHLRLSWPGCLCAIHARFDVVSRYSGLFTFCKLSVGCAMEEPEVQQLSKCLSTSYR